MKEGFLCDKVCLTFCTKGQRSSCCSLRSSRPGLFSLTRTEGGCDFTVFFPLQLCPGGKNNPPPLHLSSLPLTVLETCTHARWGLWERGELNLCQQQEMKILILPPLIFVSDSVPSPSHTRSRLLVCVCLKGSMWLCPFECVHVLSNYHPAWCWSKD